MPETARTEPARSVAADEVEDRLRVGLVVDLDAGFTEVVRVHEQVMYSVALRLVRRSPDAEDIAAEAFLRAYRALSGYGAERIRQLRLRSWLLTILRNTARHAARDAARRPGPPPVYEPVDQAAPGPGVQERVEQDQTQREWGELLARLPDAQRAAVVLRHVADLPVGEVAEILGVPEGTAKSHISRGLSKLRTLLAEHGNGAVRPPVIEPLTDIPGTPAGRTVQR